MIHMIFKKQKSSWEYECSEINRKMMIMGKDIDSIGNISAFSGQFPVMHQVMLKILRQKFHLPKGSITLTFQKIEF